MAISFGSHLGRQADFSVEDAVNSTPSSFAWKTIREKRWCYIGIVSDECISGTALVHLGYAANAFSFVYDRIENRMIEKGFVISPFSGLEFERDPDNGSCHMQSKGSRIDMLNQVKIGNRQLNLNIEKGKSRQILGEIEIEEHSDSIPLQLLTPMSNKGEKANKVFTQKIGGLKVKGFIETQHKRFSFNEQNAFALFDWTNGFHNRVTRWNWASAGGFSECGKRIGINFSKDVYTFGYGENVIWIDEKPILLGDMEFEYDAENPLNPWKIYNKEKTVELNFYPEAKRQAKEDFIFAASSFIQACGSYSGFITDANGEKIQLRQLGGVVEEHYAKW